MKQFNQTSIISLIFMVTYFTSFSQNSEITTENNLQVETIKIKGEGPSNHGQILVNQSSGTSGVVIDGGEGSGGGQINLFNSDSLSTLQIDAEGLSDVGNGPFLLMKNINNEDAVFLSAQEGITNGAALKMFNFAGVKTLELDAESGSTTGSSFLTLRDPNGQLMASILSKETPTRGARMLLRNTQDISTIAFHAQEGETNGSAIKLYNYAGELTIELDAENGNGGKGRVITQELQITGGSDFAEHFDLTTITQVKAGMVVSIDESNSGKLKLSSTKYDRKVAGIVSGANGVNTGLIMSDNGTIADGKYPIALSGRVYVRTNEENGKIQIGDFLTTSSKEGIAMKVKKIKKAHGAIIGKAMTQADANGYVLVLINLQ